MTTEAWSGDVASVHFEAPSTSASSTATAATAVPVGGSGEEEGGPPLIERTQGTGRNDLEAPGTPMQTRSAREIAKLPELPVTDSKFMDLPLPLAPEVLHGRLSNGLSYYVRANAKPKARAALALVVKVRKEAKLLRTMLMWVNILS